MMRTLAAVLLLASLAGRALAQGETSSWTSDGIVAPVARGGASKILKTAPVAVPGKAPLPPVGQGVITTRSQAPPVPILPSTLPATPPPSGDTTVAKTAGSDPAYEAFDQGRYLTALELAKTAAGNGEPQGATLAGRIYQEGLGVPRDDVQAAQWYRRGAELGDVNAMFAFGVMLAEGGALKKDSAGAAKMFEQAALKGHVAANYNLALQFLSGDGKPENPRRAFAHMQYAAENGLPNAQYDLATLYATGNGIESANAFEAAKWYQRASDAGLPEAQLDLGIVLFAGQGIERNKTRGAELFRTAAEKGNAIAQDRLALCLAFGEGVPVNLAEATKWHIIARSNGVDNRQLEQLFGKLGKSDRLKAEQAASEWRDRAALQ